MLTERDKVHTLRCALDLALEWLVCVEPHIQDSPPFKRDKRKMQDAMNQTHPLKDLPRDAFVEEAAEVLPYEWDAAVRKVREGK